MFNPSAYENARPGGIGVLEVVDGRARETEGPRLFVPLKRTELHGEITGPLASLRLVQTYTYSQAQCDRVLEAVYRFPLPGDAAVTGVLVRSGDGEIQAQPRERRAAAEHYDEARQQGRPAALLTREPPDVFTLHVAGLQPDQEVVIETAYVQRVREEGEGWSLRVPLTTAPRYVRSDERSSQHARGQPLALLRDPGHRFAMDVLVRCAGAVQSPTHALDLSPEGEAVRVRLRDGEVVPDRDCVLSWRPSLSEQPVLRVLLHDDVTMGWQYFLGLISPPAGAAASTVPREVILLVDRSGSMAGPKWEAADWAVKRFLKGLREQDSFALGLFHSTTRWFSQAPVPATAQAVEKAIQFLDEHLESGGTELGVALEQALGLPRAPGERSRHLVIITDAQVSDEGRILHLAELEAQQTGRRRISVLCIDAAPNSLLAYELAERGGGMARFLTSSADEEDIATALDEVLAGWEAPLRAGLRLEVNCADVQPAWRATAPAGEPGWSGIDLGDLPAGRSLWVVGRTPRVEVGEPVFRLVESGGALLSECRPDHTAGRSCPALKALFGARRVLELEFLMTAGYSREELQERLARLGYNPQIVAGKGRSLYAENDRAQTEATLRDLLVREALDFGLACSETGFVAVRTEAGRPVEGTVFVANSLPSGWSEHFLSFTAAVPQGTVRSPSAPAPALFALDSAVAADLHLLGTAVTGSVPARRSRPRRSVRARPQSNVTLHGPASAAEEQTAVLFAGVPRFIAGEAVLFDSTQASGAPRLPDGVTLSRLAIHFRAGPLAPDAIDRDLILLIYVDDMVLPRARVRLAELAQHTGGRPLNISRQPGQAVRIVLADPHGAWAAGAPEVELSIGWRG